MACVTAARNIVSRRPWAHAEDEVASRFWRRNVRLDGGALHAVMK